jgi:type I restriction enzyme S subunit
MIEDLQVIAPSDITEQCAIAQVLSTLERKVELNRRMNETLEAIARALFKSWFVDFDPVQAKAEGRQSVGMDSETAALFPDSFQESELGLIPKGWATDKVQTITDVVDYVANGSFASLKANVTLFDEPEYALYVRTTDFKNGFKGKLKYTTRMT